MNNTDIIATAAAEANIGYDHDALTVISPSGEEVSIDIDGETSPLAIANIAEDWESDDEDAEDTYTVMNLLSLFAQAVRRLWCEEHPSAYYSCAIA